MTRVYIPADDAHVQMHAELDANTRRLLRWSRVLLVAVLGAGALTGWDVWLRLHP